MPGISKKTKAISKNTKSASKKQKKLFSTTRTKSSVTMKSIPSQEKIDTSSSLGTKKRKTSSLSPQNVQKASTELSPHDALQAMKQRSIKNKKLGGSGWIRPTKKEHKAMSTMVQEMRESRMGRPPKPETKRKNVVSLRLTAEEMELIESAALRAGLSWRDYIRDTVLRSLKRAG